MNEKSKKTKEYRIFCQVLKSFRKGQHFQQEELAKKLKITQSFLSKIERGDRGIDIIELMQYCEAVGISLTEFSARLEYKILTEIPQIPQKSVRLKYVLSVLQSFNIT
jgi:transcriptional regulator with XRE-family HTH domain